MDHPAAHRAVPVYTMLLRRGKRDTFLKALTKRHWHKAFVYVVEPYLRLEAIEQYCVMESEQRAINLLAVNHLLKSTLADLTLHLFQSRFFVASNSHSTFG